MNLERYEVVVIGGGGWIKDDAEQIVRHLRAAVGHPQERRALVGAAPGA